MPEPRVRDFGQLARTILTEECMADPDPLAIAAVAEQLRQVWNARGAADLEATHHIAHTNWGLIDAAITTLDR